MTGQIVRFVSGFKWSPKKGDAAIELAKGHTCQYVADLIGVDQRTVYRWLADIDFKTEVDRLSLMVGAASRAERLRIANRIIRQRLEVDIVTSEKDLLDWLKFAQSETDGVKLGLTAALAEAAASVAGSGSDRADDEESATGTGG